MTAQPLQDEELLLRRFNPTDSRHVTFDEGVEPTARLNWAALEWHDDGCSVYRDHVLGDLGLTRAAILEAKYSGLASSTQRRIHDFEYHDQTNQRMVKPFSARASPRTEPPPLETDEAHASVMAIDCALSKKQIGKAQRRLAGHAFDVLSWN